MTTKKMIKEDGKTMSVVRAQATIFPYEIS